MEHIKSNLHLIKLHDKFIGFDVSTLSIYDIKGSTADFVSGMEIPEEEAKNVCEELRYLAAKGYFTDVPPPENMGSNQTNFNISIQNTLQCPLNCSYCFSKKIKTEPKNMSLEMADDIVRFIYECFDGQSELYEVYFTSGGEPLSNFPVIQEVYRKSKDYGEIYKKHMHVGLTTNAVLMDKEKLDYLEKSDIRLALSIDGKKEEHDNNRKSYEGKGSYQSVVDILPDILNSKSETVSRAAAICIITPEKKDYVGTFKYLVDLGFSKVHMKLVRNIDPEKPLVSLTDIPHIKENYIEFFDFIAGEIIRNSWKYIIPLLDPNNTIGQIILNVLLHNKILYRCDAGRSKFSILPNGDIYPCDYFSMFPDTKMGNIKTGISEDAKAEWLNMKSINLDNCKDCWCRYVCGGGCYFGRYLNNGKAEPVECEMQKFFVEEVIKMIYLISKSNKKALKHLEICSEHTIRLIRYS